MKVCESKRQQQQDEGGKAMCCSVSRELAFPLSSEGSGAGRVSVAFGEGLSPLLIKAEVTVRGRADSLWGINVYCKV